MPVQDLLDFLESAAHLNLKRIETLIHLLEAPVDLFEPPIDGLKPLIHFRTQIMNLVHY